MLIVSYSVRLPTEIHSQQWNKILITEYDLAVNVVMVTNIAIHKAFISHDLVNKLFIAKMSLAKRALIFFQCFHISKKRMEMNSCR